MASRQKTAKRPRPKTVLRLPDLEQSKNAVLNSLAAASSQDSYRHAIDELIGWYCSEPRLAFNRTVILRYRFFLEQNNLASSTINVRLAAVWRLAFEAADTGILSPIWLLVFGASKNAKRSPFSVISLQHRNGEIARISCETAISRRESTPKVLPGSTSCYFGRSEGRLKVIAQYCH